MAWSLEPITGPASYSVSKINQLISFFVFCAGLLIVGDSVQASQMHLGIPSTFSDLLFTLTFVLILIALVVLFLAGRTDFDSFKLRCQLRKSTIV